jgi:hypothetical protein
LSPKSATNLPCTEKTFPDLGHCKQAEKPAGARPIWQGSGTVFETPLSVDYNNQVALKILSSVTNPDSSSSRLQCRHLRLYRGVTLGAKRFAADDAGAFFQRNSLCQSYKP